MSEPAGIFIEFEINEKNIKKLLNTKFEEAKFGKKLGYYFSELLYEFILDSNQGIFLFNYNKKEEKCFIAYALNYFSYEDITHFSKILKIISTLKKSDSTGYAIVASFFPDLFNAYELKEDKVTEISTDDFSESKLINIIDKFVSFNKDNSFYDLSTALKKHNYFYKNFKNYYKRYLIFIEESEKPKKISNATKENPLYLFDDLYTYNSKVFFKNYNGEFTEVLDADPFTLREINLTTIADKNFVFKKKLSTDSTVQSIDNINPLETFNNFKKMIFEYQKIEGIDGETLVSFGYKLEAVYWKDKNFIYYSDELKKIDQADRKSFKYLDFGFGKDKYHIFFCEKIIPINTNNFKLNKNGFIYDEKNVFHSGNKIPLDGKSFKVINYESETNPFLGTFLLEDKNGKYEYNDKWEYPKIKKI